jgi:subtilisin family serine protease
MTAPKVALVALCTVLIGLFAGVAPAGATNDTYWNQLWGIRHVHADEAWRTATGKGATIAIVDSGVDMSHPDLKANVVPGYDFESNDNNPSDEFGHGTLVAGVAAAVANNGIGVAGVAPGAKVMPVRVLDSTGHGGTDVIDQGIRYAADHHADVINLSLGAGTVVEDVNGDTLSSGCDYAWSKGSICVVAAGNDGLFRTEWQNTKAVIVTATGPDDTEASYATSVGFAQWGIAAPGGEDDQGQTSQEIISTYWKNGKSEYAYAAGTSLAAPHVSGALAVLRGLGLSPQAAVDRMLSTATNIGSSFTFGHGLLNVAAAVAGLKQGGTKASSPHVPSPVVGGPSSPVPVNPSSGPASTNSPSASSQATARTTATPSPATEPASAAGSPRVAIFSPEPERHRGTGWTIGFVLVGIAVAGAGVASFALRRGGRA